MTVIDYLKKDKDVRKIFGKRELKIIEKQLYGVDLTQSEKNRLSRDIRSKLQVVKELARFRDEFDVKKGSEIQRIVDESKEIILDNFNVAAIILFGSAADNKLTLKSDIDIAVKLDKAGTKKATLFRKKAMGMLDKKIDLQVYNILPEKIKKQIDENGKVLYRK